MQGNNKMGQKGTNTMFVMIHEEIQQVQQASQKFTYANPVVDHWLQKEDSNRIQIIVGGNSMNNNKEFLVPMVDLLVTAKLHGNSVISTVLAK